MHGSIPFKIYFINTSKTLSYGYAPEVGALFCFFPPSLFRGERTQHQACFYSLKVGGAILQVFFSYERRVCRIHFYFFICRGREHFSLLIDGDGGGLRKVSFL